MDKRLELGINICSLFLLVGIVVLLLHPPPSRAAQRAIYKAGERFQVPGLAFTNSAETLVLVVRQGCHFCEASMPFYKSLGDSKTAPSQFRLVAVGPDQVEATKTNFASHGVVIDDVVQVALSDLKVSGTPTAVLVDRSGTVLGVWQGQLDADGEKSVEAALRPPALGGAH